MLERKKVAFCSKDTEYRERFVRCWMRHYKSLYDFYAFEEIAAVVENVESTFDVIILDSSAKEEIETWVMQNIPTVFLYVENVMGELAENFVWEPKYQEVYKIHDAAERLIGRGSPLSKQEDSHKIIGVFSMGCEDLQIPFSALVAKEYAEKKRTILINLQPYTGWEKQDGETESPLGMEDFILSVQTGNYSKSRLMGAIGHEENWDYVYSVKNTECLAEVTSETYKDMLEILATELGYQVIIINFGAIFLGVHTLMRICEGLYFLTHKLESVSVREQNYFKELEQKGYEEVIQRTSKIELPYTSNLHLDFKQIVQQWRWSTVGDTLRKTIWME